jgi:hypothetical protein
VEHPPGDGEDHFAAALAALREAWVQVLAGLRAIDDPQHQFDSATEAGELLRKLVSENAEQRAAAAVRIQDAESLSLAALGERISMTKQAAGRLTGRARHPRKGQ